MSSRSPSPPYGGGRRCVDADGQSGMARLSLRPRRGSRRRPRTRRRASLPPVRMSRDRNSCSPPLPNSVGRGSNAPLQPQHHKESGLGSELDAHYAPPQPQHHEGSGSGSELDSPPHITFFTEEEEPCSPLYPPVPPSRIDARLSTDWNEEEDQYFNSLVDNFVSATADMCNYTSPYDDIDYKALSQSKCVMYAESALKHYNNDEMNEIKYELISGITSCDMFDEKGCFSHVNFTAKGYGQNSADLFFAELRDDHGNLEPTCVVSLEGIKKVGGLCDSRYDNKIYWEEGLPIDAQHCYARDHKLKHPKNGELYVMGHVAVSDYYHG